MDQTKNFHLHKNKLIDTSMNGVPGVPSLVNNTNLTDEIAIRLLQSNKGYQKFFKHFPDDWEELIQQPIEDAVKKAQRISAEEAEATKNAVKGNMDSLATQMAKRVAAVANQEEADELLADLEDTFDDAMLEQTFGDLSDDAGKVIDNIKKELSDLSATFTPGTEMKVVDDGPEGDDKKKAEEEAAQEPEGDEVKQSEDKDKVQQKIDAMTKDEKSTPNPLTEEEIREAKSLGILTYDRSAGIQYAENNLGKSYKAATAEINANPELLKAISVELLKRGEQSE